MKAVRWHFPLEDSRPLITINFKIPQVETFWHWHPETELTFILRGDGTRKIGNHTEKFSSGDVVLIGGGLPHAYWGKNPQQKTTSKEDWHEVIVIIFKHELDQQHFADMPQFAAILERAKKRGVGFGPQSSSQLIDIARQMVHNNTPAKMAHFYRIIETITQANDLHDLNSEDYESHSNHDNSLLNRATSYLEENFRSPIHLDDVAHHIHMKPDTFSRWFKKLTGYTYREYITIHRISYAQQRLTDTDKTIAEIAFDAGFENIANFNTLFKRRSGMTPKEYRTHSREEAIPIVHLSGITENHGYIAVPEGVLKQVHPIV